MSVVSVPPAARPVRGIPRLASESAARTVRVRSPLHEATVELLARADDALSRACRAETVAERYILAHICAQRAATAVLAERATGRGGRQQVWPAMARMAPELQEWAIFFDETGRMRAAVEAGDGQVSLRQADDLVREAERFTVDVFRVLDIHVVVDP